MIYCEEINMKNNDLEKLKQKLNNDDIVILLGSRSPDILAIEEEIYSNSNKTKEVNPWGDYETPMERIEAIEKYLRKKSANFDFDNINLHKYIVVNDAYSLEAFEIYSDMFDVDINVYLVEEDKKVTDITKNLEDGYGLFLEPFEYLDGLNSIFD